MRTSSLAVAAAVGLLAAAPAHAIVGGTDVPAGQYRAVAQVSAEAAVLEIGCTGTLIAPTWVMTAAHCMEPTGAVEQPIVTFPPETVVVRLGSNKRGQGTPHSVAKVIVEPRYFMTNAGDIALLQLTSAVTGIAPVPVANSSERALWAPGAPQKIVGWGQTAQNCCIPDTLQQATVPVLSDAYCESRWGPHRNPPEGQGGYDANTMVCAGVPGGVPDICQGDSGGPLLGTDPATGALRVAGVGSWGPAPCAQAGLPSVFARVADTTLRTWIASVAPDAIAP